MVRLASSAPTVKYGMVKLVSVLRTLFGMTTVASHVVVVKFGITTQNLAHVPMVNTGTVSVAFPVQEAVPGVLHLTIASALTT